MGKNKNKAKQDEQPEKVKEMSFEVVDDEPKDDKDDEWIVPGKQGQSKVDHKPVTRGDTKKTEIVFTDDKEEQSQTDEAKKSKNQLKKEKKAEKEAQEKKAQEEAEKNANKKKKNDAKKDSTAPKASTKASPEPKSDPKKGKEKETTQKKAEEPKVLEYY